VEHRDQAQHHQGLAKSVAGSGRASRAGAPVEHPFHVVKNRFNFRKLRYRGLTKNTAQLYSLFALANLVIAKKALLAPAPA
jgi:IS5 family transposase